MEMLKHLGIKSVDELFRDVPKEIRTDGLKIRDGLSELGLKREMAAMMAINITSSDMPSFLGAGVYNHFIPSAVKAIASRSEFVTSYTPYQPEISQGMLQALFEYQSFMAELLAIDVVNSSMYDASTSLGEAILMSHRITGGKRFLLSRAISPEKKAVARTYAKGADIELDEVGYDPGSGTVDLEDLRAKLAPEVSGFYFETPNYFGPLETRAAEIRDILETKTMVVGVNPMALALVRPPGEFGADIVIGDGQVFGIPMSLGGPMIGVFGCKTEHVRKMPGRLVGMTVDSKGERAYCMTLQTREQNIRRSKATSNICTNEALLGVVVAAYLSVVGRSGLRRIAARNIENMDSLARRISRINGFVAPHFRSVHFNEFVVTSETDPAKIHSHLLSNGVHGGHVLKSEFPELGNAALYATTEMHTKADHDKLIEALEGIR